jgi:hypothetical protein
MSFSPIIIKYGSFPFFAFLTFFPNPSFELSNSILKSSFKFSKIFSAYLLAKSPTGIIFA